MMRLRLLTILVAVCTVMAFGSLADVATAEFMTVDNHSFESPDIDGWPSILPDGWSGVRGSGSLCEGAYFPSVGVTGDQAFGLDERIPAAGGPTAIYQDLGSIGVVDSWLPLMVDVAARADDHTKPPARYTVQLEDADSGVVLAFKYNAPIPSRTAFQECSTDTVLVPAGTSIRVRLFVLGGGGKYQTFMDNVRVESTPIPAPSPLVVTGVGLLGGAAFSRRRKER